MEKLRNKKVNYNMDKRKINEGRNEGSKGRKMTRDK